MMKIYQIIALSLLLTQSQCSTCTLQPDDALVLVAETSEFISRNIPDLFKLPSEDFTISDQKEILKIVPTLELKDSRVYQFQQPQSIQAVKIYKDLLTQQSLNQFLYMEIQTDRISYISNSPLQGSQVPTIMQSFFWEELEDVGTLTCFDLDFITTDIQIIDCIIKPTVAGTPMDFATLIYTRTADGRDRLQLQNFNPQQYKSATSTIMKTQGNYIYRGVPHYALTNEQSAIDIMLYNNAPQEIGLITSLNQQVLTQLLNQPTYELQMVDFRVSNGHNIALLNTNGDVIHVQYTEKTQKWALIKLFNTKIELLAFDYDFYSNRFVGVSVNQIVYASGPTYTFSTNLVEPKVFFTLSYVIVTTPTKLYHFGNSSPIPIPYDMDPYFQIIADQKQNAFLFFGKKQMRKYLLNEYSTLRLFGTTKLANQSTSITQKLDQDKVCVLKIQLNILEKATYQIVPIHDPQYFLPYGIDWAYAAVDHNRVFEGPNLKFSAETGAFSAVNLEFATHGQYIFEAINNQDKITYIKFFQQQMSQFLYIIQTNDLKVSIYDCPLNLTASVCNLRTSFALKVQMNDQNAQITYSSGVATLFVLETAQQISAYLISQTVGQPTIFGKITNGAYVQIKLGYEQLFAINVQAKIITSFKIKNTTTYPLQITIDENFMLERGYKTWTPEVIGAGELKDVLAVFDSENKLTLISYKNSPNCYIIAQQDDFRYQGIVERVLDVMPTKVIAVIKYQNLAAYIYVENIENEANVYLQRSVFLQRFAFEQKLNYQSSYKLAYLITKTTLKQNYVVLVLDLERIALSTIYTMMDCDEYSFISAHNNYLLIQSRAKTSANLIDKDLSIWARNSVNSDKYLENVVRPIQVKSDDSEFNYEQTLKIVNTYKNIQMDQNKVKVTNLDQLKSRTQDACYDLGLDFIKGNAVAYKASCAQCVPGKVQISSPLVYGQNICKGGLDIQNLNENQFVVLYADKLTLVQKDTLKFVDFQFDNEFTCKQMEIIDQGVFVLCSFGNPKQEVLIRYKCITNVCLRSGKSLILPDDVLQYKYIENYLFVGSASKMQIHYIANLDKFDEVVLVKETQLELRRFAVTKIGTNNYQLYMIQIDEQLNLQTQTLTKEVATLVDNTIVSLYDLVTEANYYVGKNTIFNGIFNLKQEVELEHSRQLLFTTSDVAQYVIQFTFTEGTSSILRTSIPFILSQYGYWNTNANPQVSISKKYIAMSYESVGSRAVLIYRNQAPADKTIPVLSIGGLEDPAFAQDNQVLLYELDGQTKFIATSGITYSLNEYTITESLQLCLKGEIYDQVVSINVINNFGNSILPVNIALIQENDAKSKSLWWVWLLVALAIGGGAFGLYWYKKKKQQRKVDDNYGPLS